MPKPVEYKQGKDAPAIETISPEDWEIRQDLIDQALATGDVERLTRIMVEMPGTLRLRRPKVWGSRESFRQARLAGPTSREILRGLRRGGSNHLPESFHRRLRKQ